MQLLIETSSSNCSVALSHNGVLIQQKGMNASHFVHAEKLHVFIHDVIDKAGITVHDIQSVAISKGPGSYTGLRIGVSAAKGLCFALGIPLVAIDTTHILAHYARAQNPKFDLYVPMIDARRMEVYTCVYNHILEQKASDVAVILDENYFRQWEGKRVLFVGDGAEKAKHLMLSTHETLSVFPDAAMMVEPGDAKFNSGSFEDIAYFEPFYLKEYLPGMPKKTIF